MLSAPPLVLSTPSSGLIAVPGAVCAAPVSYTHLDVYKRQGFARRAADRILFMADGQIVEEATPEQFFTDPQTSRAQDFLSKILGH